MIEIGQTEIEFLKDICLSLVCGILIGGERESRGKPAGISTQCFIIGASTLFAFMSKSFGDDPSRIAAQIVSGVGFLGAGIIIKDGNKITNLTTAASIWYAAAIGMALGFNLHLVAVIATIYAVLVPRIPKIKPETEN